MPWILLIVMPPRRKPRDPWTPARLARVAALHAEAERIREVARARA